MIPNSPPPSGKNASMPDAPTSEKLVNKNDPHAVHPTPTTPAIKPMTPVALPDCATSFILCFRK